MPFACFVMETFGLVQFRNVGCSYFPESRVDCHYTLSSQHSWASSDWIGLFKVLLPCRLAQKINTCSAGMRKPPKKNSNYPDVTVFSPQVGWSSVRDYHTFVWALAPADYEEGTEVNCCVQFQGTKIRDCFTILFYSPLCFVTVVTDKTVQPVINVSVT